MLHSKSLLIIIGSLFLPVTVTAQGIISFGAGSLNNSSLSVSFTTGEVVSGNFSNPNFSLLGGLVGFTDNLPTSGEPQINEIPLIFQLNQNYPNPFNPTTTISYQLPRSATVRIDIYNSIGAKVASFTEGNKPAGVHSIQFNASAFASGLYLYRFIADGALISTKKMMLIK